MLPGMMSRQEQSSDVGHRCRLCTTNDHDALVEQLAAELWTTTPEDGRTWEQAGGYWQDAFRVHAATAVRLLRG